MIQGIKTALTTVAKFLFNTPTYQSEFEQFIADKNVKTPQDLEFWHREYAERRMVANRMRHRGDYRAAEWYMKI